MNVMNRTLWELHPSSFRLQPCETWLTLWFAACWRVARPTAPMCIFTDWRQLPTVTDALQAGGWVWRGIVVWDKTEAARPQPGRFRAQCEYIVWGSKGAWWTTDGAPLPGCVRLPVTSRDKQHLTAKPKPILRWLLSACPPGGVVLDPCSGSGTTGSVAQELGMGFVGFELHPDYADTAMRLTDVIQTGLLTTEEAPDATD
jgi:site-specific DNA-methyltransferase (adenine-specific)